MKISEISKQYGFDEYDFQQFLAHKREIRTSGAFSPKIDDEDVEKAVNLYTEEVIKPREEKRLAAEKAEEEKRLAAEKAEQDRIQKAQEKQRAMAEMLISSGFNFEGYRIVKYSGYISGDDAVQIPRSGVFGGKNGQNLTDALVKIRIQAIKELKEAAYELGCNAVVGVDFDYITLEPETASLTGGTLYEPYIICVTANGNAVIIEKEE